MRRPVSTAGLFAFIGLIHMAPGLASAQTSETSPVPRDQDSCATVLGIEACEALSSLMDRSQVLVSADMTGRKVVFDFHGQIMGAKRFGEIVRIAAVGPLPAWANAVVMRNFKVYNDVLLYRLNVGRSLTIENGSFGSLIFKDSSFGAANCPEGSAADLSIVRSKFEMWLSFTGYTTFCGSVELRNNESGMGLVFDGGDNVREPRIRAHKYISLTRIKTPLLEFKGLEGGDIFVNDVQADFIRAYYLKSSRIYFSYNSIDISLGIIESTLASLAISSNQIPWVLLADVTLDKSQFPEQEQGCQPRAPGEWPRWNEEGWPCGLVLRGNLAQSFDIHLMSLDEGAILEASHNQIENSSKIYLPKNWSNGVLDLTGSTFSGQLALYLGEPNKEEKIPPGSGRCQSTEPAGKSVRVRFDYATIHTLSWHLPLDCTYRWSGLGAGYTNWGDPWVKEYRVISEYCKDDAAECDPDKIIKQDLLQWINLLETPSIDVYTTLAEYMEDHGLLLEARQLMSAAQRGAYFGLEEAPVNLSDEQLFDSISRRLAGTLLMVVGWGAQPEMALFWLFGLYVAATLTNIIYSLFYISPERNVVQQQQLHMFPRSSSTLSGAAPRGQRLGALTLAILKPAFSKFAPPLAERVRRAYDVWDRRVADSSLPTPQPSNRGLSRVVGFRQYNLDREPEDFGLSLYALDTVLPVINLHLFDEFYPEWSTVRVATQILHALGWLLTLFTTFTVSAAIL